MDTLYHREDHFRGGATVKDIVIGMSDGLTVPFALAAGISGAISAAHIVVTAGFAEIAAGSIAMGLGGYLAARSEVEHYRSELAREEAEIREKPEVEAEEVASFFREYGLTEAEYNPVVAGLRTKPKAWRDFMMRFELGMEEPDPKRALQSAITIALSYVACGIVPLGSLYSFPRHQDGVLLFGSVYVGSAGGLRICERKIHRRFDDRKRSADRAGRRTGRCFCLWTSQIDFLS